MLRLHYSNRVEVLLQDLAGNLATVREQSALGFLSVQRIIVPNPNIRRWVEFALAREHGACFGVRFEFMLSYLTRLLECAIPGARAITKERLHMGLFHLLHAGVWEAHPELGPVRAYLGGRDAPDFAPKLYQLSRQLAQAFDDYATSRPELTTAWSEGRCSFPSGSPEAGMERWQGALWRLLFGPEGCLRSETPQGFLPDLAELATRTEAGREALARAAEGPLHVFGFSYVSVGFGQILDRLARAVDVVVYSLNPCQEYWEDVRTLREDFALKRRTSPSSRLHEAEALLAPAEGEPFLVNDERDFLALKLWGRPGREHVKMLNVLTNYDWLGDFPDPLAEADDNLHRFQANLRNRIEPAVPWFDPDDESIRFVWAPGVRREVEFVADEIWRILAASQGEERLRFQDIAVIVPAGDVELYHAHIRSVFAEYGQIPVSLVDSPPRVQSALVDGLLAILELAGTELTRQNVLKVLSHPLIRSRLSASDVDLWKSWCEVATIARGADATAWDGTFVEGEDLYNWDQGLVRLLLGSLMDLQTADGSTVTVEFGNRKYLPLEVKGGMIDEAARFLVLARSLIADVRFLQEESLPLAEWSRFLRELVNGYFPEAPFEEEAISEARRRCLGAIADVGAMAIDATTSFPFAAVAGFFRERIESSLAFAKNYLTDGVVAASFLPMRPVPFRVVFLLGMGEGKFPAGDSFNPLDLRHSRRKAGDVWPREQDKYMFLETLLLARERVCISWVARHEVTGHALEPSGIVKELWQCLGLTSAQLQALARRNQLDLRRHKSVLRGSQGEWPVTVAEEAWHEASCRALRDDLAEFLATMVRKEMPLITDVEVKAIVEKRIGRLVWHRERAAFVRSLPAEARARLNEFLAIPDLLAKPSSPKLPSVIDLARLERFLEAPLQSYARNVFRLAQDDADDYAAVEDEPVEMSPLEESLVIRPVFLEAVAQLDRERPAERWGDAWFHALGRELRDSLEARVRLEELRGRIPVGVVGEAKRRMLHQRLLEMGAGLCMTLAENGMEGPARFTSIAIGAARESDAVHQTRPHLLLLTDRGPVRVAGRVEALRCSESAAQIIVLSPTQVRLRHFVKGWFQLVLLAAVGYELPERCSVVVVNPGRAKRDGLEPHAQFVTPTPEQARSYLASVVGDAFGEVCDHILPIELVEEEWRNHHRKASEPPFIDLLAKAAVGQVPDADLARLNALVSARLAETLEDIARDALQAAQRGDTPMSHAFGPVRRLTPYGVPPAPFDLLVRRYGLFCHCHCAAECTP